MSDDDKLERALERGTVVLSGGRDVQGNILLTIPTAKLADLAECDIGEVAAIFLHFATISKYLRSKDKSVSTAQPLWLGCVADLRHASTQSIKQLVESLECVEQQQRGTISVVYFLKPRTKTKSHILKKLLGVKPSKKRPRVPLFKVELMKTLQELHMHVDVSQLTADFCGTLQYNHNSWLHLYNVVIKCIEGCQDLLVHLPSMRDKVDLLQEYETDGQTSSQLQQLLADLIEKFHIIISESSLPLCLTQSKQTLFLLDHPSTDTQLSSIHPELIKGLQSHLRDLYTELDTWNKDLDEIWRITENRLTILIQIHRHRERAKEIERKICEHYHPLLREHPIVGRTLSQAELYRAHFTTTLYDPAKELLSQATEILEAVQKLKNAALQAQTGSTTGGHHGPVSPAPSVVSGLDISDITQCLTTSIQPFTTQLQQLQQLYVSIHIFHLLFEKALSWYKKVLKFLPESLLRRCSLETGHLSINSAVYNQSPQGKEDLVYMPSEWLGAVRVFLSRHPPPRQEHIDRLDESIPHLVDRKLRAQARSLALRLHLLQRVLSSTRLPLKLLTAVMEWRVELFGLSQPEKPGAHFPTEGPGKSGQMSGPSQTSAFATSDHVEMRDLLQRDKQVAAYKPHTTRIHERNPRARKIGSDQDVPSKGQPSHLNLSKSTSGVTTSEEMKVPEKMPARKMAPRTVSRSKSVEFNFNSSSTDGSVFDYDKALVQAEASPEMVRAKFVPRIPRKSRSSVKDSKLPSERRPSIKAIWTEDQAFSDPSEMLLHRSQIQQKQTDPLSRENVPTDEIRTDVSSDDLVAGGFRQRSDSVPDPAPTSLSTSQSERFQKQPYSTRNRKKPSALNPSVTNVNNEERFIRVTFTPNQIQANSSPVFNFDNVDKLRNVNHENLAEDDESGIETAEGSDPYDNVVLRIREISASNLSNVEKLKQVSELLSKNTFKRADSKRFAEELSASKLSFSTLDLRSKLEVSSDNEVGSKSEYSTQDVRPYSGERPVDAVQRMKRNLAKSMEDLQSISLYPLETSRQINDEPTNHMRESNSESYQGNQQVRRYISELRIQPVYRTPEEAVKEITVIKSDSKIHRASDVEAPRQTSSPRNEEVSRSRSWSDVEPTNFEMDGSHDTYHIHKHHHKTDCSKHSSNLDGGNMQLRHSSDDILLDDHFQSGLFQDVENKSSITRPNSLSLSSNQNFISPSFLRPASSMKDLSSRNYPEMTFNNVYDPEIDMDFQALEDLEMLQRLQEDPFSNEISKYAAVLKQPDERQSSKHSQPVRSESLRSAEPASPAVSSSQSPSLDQRNYLRKSATVPESVTTKSFDLNVPEIQVGYALDHMSSMEQEEDTRTEESYKIHHTPDPNFDRLTNEADQEYLSQEQVASSLRKTQKMLENEERRQSQRPYSATSDVSPEGNEGDEEQKRLNQSTSLDYGYGSWTSKLMSAQSMSSEGAGADQDSLYSRDWRKLSSSSGESATKSHPHGWNRGSYKESRNRASDGDEEDDDNEEDLMTNVPWLEIEPIARGSNKATAKAVIKLNNEQ